MTTEEFKKEIWDFEQGKGWKYLGYNRECNLNCVRSKGDSP